MEGGVWPVSYKMTIIGCGKDDMRLFSFHKCIMRDINTIFQRLYIIDGVGGEVKVGVSLIQQLFEGLLYRRTPKKKIYITYVAAFNLTCV